MDVAAEVEANILPMVDEESADEEAFSTAVEITIFMSQNV
jgi:hypothetical protein